MEPIILESRISKSIKENRKYFHEKLNVDVNFDMLYRDIVIGGRDSVIYFIDGFCKDELMMKMLQYFIGLTAENLPENAAEMLKSNMPYVEVDMEDRKDKIATAILSGQLALFIDGYDKCILIDSRTYPARSVSEPDKDKALRGSKDGFVETIIFNTALIRRRIRDTDLCVEMLQAGTTSKTDIALLYMGKRVNENFLMEIKSRIKGMKVDALTLNQESLAECLYDKKWINPFPKFRFTERPDTSAAQILEGNIVILVDNAPQAMILPTSLFDITEEADDYYFPPVTGTYLRFAKFVILVFSYFVTPLYLLLSNNPQWIPESFAFIQMKDPYNIPIFWQFIILEVALDGLRLAAVNTPNMLSTPLSIMAALILGDFSVSSGWFNAEVMLYMAFVALANYTQTNYELAYAVKFMRILNLVLTSLFGIYGFIAGIGILILSLINNKMISGRGYLYPLIPFHFKQLKKRLLRRHIRNV